MTRSKYSWEHFSHLCAIFYDIGLLLFGLAFTLYVLRLLGSDRLWFPGISKCMKKQNCHKVVGAVKKIIQNEEK